MKINKQPVIKRTTYSKEELDSLLNEVGGNLSHASRNKWLIKHGAIRVQMLGTAEDIVVIQAPDGSFPYSELSDKWSALEKRQNGKEYAKRVEVSRSTDEDEKIIDILEIDEPEEDVVDINELRLFG